MVWWDGEDLLANGFLTMIVGEGAKNVRVEFHHRTKMLVVVDKETGEVCGSYNEAHECPIDCP